MWKEPGEVAMRKLFGIIPLFLVLSGIVACSDDSASASNAPSGTEEVVSGSDLELALPMGESYIVYTGSDDEQITIGWYNVYDGTRNWISAATTDTLTAIAAFENGLVVYIVGGNLIAMNVLSQSGEGELKIKGDTLVRDISGLGKRSAIAVDASGIYYKDGNSIMGIPLDKGKVDLSASPVKIVDRVYDQDDSYKAFKDLIVSDGVLYASVAWDSPNGVVVSADLNNVDWQMGERPKLTTFMDGLSSPADLQATAYYVCVSGLSINCASKGLKEKKVVPASVSFPANNYRLASHGDNLFYQASDGYYYRYALDSGTQTKLTNHSSKAMSGTASHLGSLVAVKGKFYWLERSDAIYYLDLDNFEASQKEEDSGSMEISPPSKLSNQCLTETGSYVTTPYASRYMGRFEYRVIHRDEDMVTEATSTSSFTMNIAMECVASMMGFTTLKIVWAQSSEPFFGCLMGCTPNDSSAAVLPSGEANPALPSGLGATFVIKFPNGSLLTTSSQEGEMNVSTDGRTIASDFDAGYGVSSEKQMTWTAANMDGTVFPDVKWPDTAEMPSWIFNQSQL